MAALDLTPLVQAFLPARFYGKAKATVAAVLSVCNVAGTLLPLLAGAPPWVAVVIGAVVTVLTPVAVFLTGNETAHQPEHDGTTELPAAD